MNLADIKRPATADNAAIHLHPLDNVAVARLPLPAGQPVRLAGVEVRLLEAVPAGHKIALRRLGPGETVIRYGESIGRASGEIAPGGHVHTQNVAYQEQAPDYEFPSVDLPPPELPAGGPSFLGYRRSDGRAGTRNYIGIVAASNCAAHAAVLAAREFEDAPMPETCDGVAAFPHGDGCGEAIGPDTELLRRTVAGVLNHPNVHAAVILGLGCEVNQIDPYLNLPGVAGITLQTAGGTRATVERAVREIRRMIESAASERRVELPASRIVLGLNCGGSDSFSGITANPALGACSDRLAALGASVVLAETPEIFGAEHLLVRRSRNRRVAERLLGFVGWYKEYLSRFAGSFNDNPSPGNKDGGLTNILEKSLGAVAKSGASPLMDAVDYAERIASPGFVFMNTPGYDPVSLAGLAAGGTNLIAFTTGRGSAIGFPTVPVIKIASNTDTWRRMRDNMDVNAGVIADGDGTVQSVGGEILDLVLRVASGEKTCAEKLGHREFVPWRIGPVM